jgi:trans-aconitate methyltransferase
MTAHIYRNPKQYSINNALQYNFAMKLLSKISFDSQARVLDVGCGDGLITNEISRIVHDGCVIGTDISEQMIAFASKKYLDQLNLRFLVMDANKNIFREQFDIVTSFNCLHWVKDQQNALFGIAKSTVDGALIALLLSHKKSLYHHVLDKLCSSSQWNHYFIDFISPRSFFDPYDYSEMLAQSGLKVIEIFEEEMTYAFKSKEQLKNFFKTAGAQIKKIPEDKQSDFLNEFVNQYLQESESYREEEILVSFWCLQVIAMKQKSKLMTEN